MEKLSNPKSLESMARFGINTKKAHRISIPILRKMAKQVGKNHILALKLYKMDKRETKILASMIDDFKQVTKKQMNV